MDLKFGIARGRKLQSGPRKRRVLRKKIVCVLSRTARFTAQAEHTLFVNCQGGKLINSGKG